MDSHWYEQKQVLLRINNLSLHYALCSLYHVLLCRCTPFIFLSNSFNIFSPNLYSPEFIRNHNPKNLWWKFNVFSISKSKTKRYHGLMIPYQLQEIIRIHGLHETKFPSSRIRDDLSIWPAPDPFPRQL